MSDCLTYELGWVFFPGVPFPIFSIKSEADATVVLNFLKGLSLPLMNFHSVYLGEGNTLTAFAHLSKRLDAIILDAFACLGESCIKAMFGPCHELC